MQTPEVDPVPDSGPDRATSDSLKGAGEPARTGEPQDSRDREGSTERSFKIALGGSGALIGILVIAPMLRLYSSGRVFGADWSEYLYTGPTYLAGGHPLFQYPYPLLPVAYLPLDYGLGHLTLTSVYVVDCISGLLVLGCMYAGYLVCRALTASRWAGLVGGLVVGGFPLLQLEVGWGGQAQLVAYALGLLALWLTIGRTLTTFAIRPALLAGVFLAIAVTAELYSAAVIGLTLVLFLPLALGRRVISRRGVGIYVATLAPSLGAILFLLSVFPGSANPASGGKLATYWHYGPLWNQLWADLTFRNSVLAAIYIGILCVYVAYRVTVRAPSRVQGWLVPASGASALVVGALLTPALNSSRALYPLVFPLAFAIAELASLWPGAVPGPPRRVRWGLPAAKVARLFPVLVAAGLVVTAAQLGVDVQLYPNSLATYTYDQGMISELFFLSHEPGAILYDSSPVDHTFVNLWATDRTIYPGPAFEPYTVTNAAGQAAVVLGTSLSYGEDWISDGAFVLTGAEPAWGQPAPGILLVKNAHIFTSIESNDFENAVSYSPGSSPAHIYSTDLFYADSIQTTVGTNSLATTYTFTGFSVDRSLLITSSGTQYWNYSYLFTTAIPRSVTLHVTDSERVKTEGVLLTNTSAGSTARVIQQFSESPLPPISQSYSIASTVRDANLTSGLVPSNQYGILELDYGLTPTNTTTRTFSLNFTIQPFGAGGPTPTAHSEGDVLAATGIHWVVLSRSSNQIILQRFMDDPTYELYRVTPHYWVLSVV